MAFVDEVQLAQPVCWAIFVILMVLAMLVWLSVVPSAPRMEKQTLSETASTATGPRSSGSTRSNCEASPVSCWSLRDMCSLCMGGERRRAAEAGSDWSAEYKYGHARSDLYNTPFSPMNDDLDSLLQAAAVDPKKHEEVSRKLRQMQSLCASYPGSGWVQPRDVRVLLRFLVARQLDVSRAVQMLQSTLQWRQRSGVSRVLPCWDKAFHEHFDRYWKCMAFTGLDRDGDPVVVERTGLAHGPSIARCSDEFLKRHVMYNAECVMASLDCYRQQGGCGFQVTVIADLEGVDMSVLDRRLLALSKELGKIESENYPEVLKRVIVVNAPWVFPILFQMVKRFLDAGSIAKIVVPKAEDTRRVLLQYMPSEAIPKALGGSLKGDDYCSELIPAGGEVPEVILAVGRGNAAGRPARDKVCLGPQQICAETEFLTAVQMSDEPFSLFPFDGMVGLGLPALSRSKEYNFFGNLAEAHQLEKDRFAVWLATEDDREDSEVSFGSIPSSRLGSDIAWLPLSSTTTGLWQVAMKDLTVNLVRQGLCAKKSGCHAAFDTGTGVIAGPKVMIDAIMQELNVATDCSNWDELPALGFELGERIFNIEKHEYVQRTSEGCFPQLAALQDTAHDGAPTFFLGAPFLTRYLTIYDRVFLRMGLAFSAHRKEPTEETTAQAAKRLFAREAIQ
ncbi:unnamed protein product [Effrenium voratum]|uniref:Uncharacterized protein n=1 Tax=Effrenium voratum TaxID=2562239 RepID=A0AA36MMB6_9DINO|nr:unnamed protein product [Effrenium voratum]